MLRLPAISYVILVLVAFAVGISVSLLVTARLRQATGAASPAEPASTPLRPPSFDTPRC